MYPHFSIHIFTYGYQFPLSFPDLPLPRYLWDIAKSTTRAERLLCAAAMIALFACILLVVYFTVIVKRASEEVVDVGKDCVFYLTILYKCNAYVVTYVFIQVLAVSALLTPNTYRSLDHIYLLE